MEVSKIKSILLLATESTVYTCCAEAFIACCIRWPLQSAFISFQSKEFPVLNNM